MALKNILKSFFNLLRFPINGVLLISLLLIIISMINTPLVLLLIMIGISIMPFLASIPKSWRLSNYTKLLLGSLINVFVISGLYRCLYRFYIFLNFHLTFKGFKLYTIFFGIIFLLYLALTRYILYLSFEHCVIAYWLYIVFYLASIGVIIRGVTSFTLIIIPYILCNYPEFNSVLNTGPEIPLEIPEVVKEPIQPSSSKNYWGIFNRHTHHHNYQQIPPEIPRSHFHRNFGYGVACVGLCFSVFACVQYYKSANAALVSAHAALASANEAKRSADIAARQAGLISEQTYYERHPQDKPK